VIKNQEQDTLQHAAVFGAVPMLRPEDLLHVFVNMPVKSALDAGILSDH